MSWPQLRSCRRSDIDIQCESEHLWWRSVFLVHQYFWAKSIEKNWRVSILSFLSRSWLSGAFHAYNGSIDRMADFREATKNNSDVYVTEMSFEIDRTSSEWSIVSSSKSCNRVVYFADPNAIFASVSSFRCTIGSPDCLCQQHSCILDLSCFGTSCWILALVLDYQMWVRFDLSPKSKVIAYLSLKSTLFVSSTV